MKDSELCWGIIEIVRGKIRRNTCKHQPCWQAKVAVCYFCINVYVPLYEEKKKTHWIYCIWMGLWRKPCSFGWSKSFQRGINLIMEKNNNGAMYFLNTHFHIKMLIQVVLTMIIIMIFIMMMIYCKWKGMWFLLASFLYCRNEQWNKSILWNVLLPCPCFFPQNPL